MEFSKQTLNKSPTDKIIYNMNKHLNINPFNKKINNKLSKTANTFCNKVLKPEENKTKKIKESQKNIDEIKQELEKYDVPVTDVETLLSDLNRSFDNRGPMEFSWNGRSTFQNQQVLVLGYSKSGKSVLINSLILELDVPFTYVCVFTGKSSFENEACQCLKSMTESASLQFSFFNTDIDKPIEYCEPGLSFEDYKKKYTEEDGSVSKIYKNSFPSVYLFEDLYSKPVDSHIFKFMEDMSIKSRHDKISFFINYQSYTRLSSKILDNLTKLFIHKDFLPRSDLFRKLRINPPVNLQEVLAEPYEEQTRFYYLDDGYLQPYNSYQYLNKNQVIKKMRSKASIGFIDKKKKKIYEEKTKIIKEYEEQEKEKIKKNKDSETQDPLKEKESVNNIPINPKEQKQLIGKNVSNDSLKLNPYAKNINYESNKINPRFSRFNYNFVMTP